MILVLVIGGGGERPMPISRKRCRPRGLTRSIRIVIGAAISGRLPPEPEAISRQEVEPPDPVDTSIRGMPYRHVDAAPTSGTSAAAGASLCSGVSNGVRAGAGVALGAGGDPGLTPGHFPDTFRGVLTQIGGPRGRDHDIATEGNVSVATGTQQG